MAEKTQRVILIMESPDTCAVYWNAWAPQDYMDRAYYFTVDNVMYPKGYSLEVPASWSLSSTPNKISQTDNPELWDLMQSYKHHEASISCRSTERACRLAKNDFFVPKGKAAVAPRDQPTIPAAQIPVRIAGTPKLAA